MGRAILDGEGDTMSTELLPCPCCNGKAKTSDGGFGPVNQNEVFSLHFVECGDCGLMVAADTLDKAIRLWNRRFVCLDKNGDKVFSDSKFLIEKEMFMFKWHPEFLRYDIHFVNKPNAGARCSIVFCRKEIELIKEQG